MNQIVKRRSDDHARGNKAFAAGDGVHRLHLTVLLRGREASRPSQGGIRRARGAPVPGDPPGDPAGREARFRVGLSPRSVGPDDGEPRADGEGGGDRFLGRTFTTNSHKALLLAEAAKEEGSAVFEALNEGLFRAYFTEGRNIGDPEVLRDVAQAAGVPAGRLVQAWSDAAYEERLAGDRGRRAVRHYGDPRLHRRRPMDPGGAVPVEMLREAAKKISAGKS